MVEIVIDALKFKILSKEIRYSKHAAGEKTSLFHQNIYPCSFEIYEGSILYLFNTSFVSIVFICQITEAQVWSSCEFFKERNIEEIKTALKRSNTVRVMKLLQ